MTKYKTTLFLLIFVFVSVFIVSVPQTLYSEDTVDCTYCWQPVPRV